MACLYHKEREEVAVCSECGALICEACAVRVSGRSVCKSCVQKMIAGAPYDRGEYGSAPPRRKYLAFSPGMAFLLSFIPGTSQMYMGFLRRGLCILGAFFLSCSLASGFFGGMIFGFLIPMIWALSLFDALELRRKLIRGVEVKDNIDEAFGFVRRHRTLCTIFGVIALLNFTSGTIISFFPEFLHMRSLIGPLFICGGIYLLWRHRPYTKGRRADEDDVMDMRDRDDNDGR